MRSSTRKLLLFAAMLVALNAQAQTAPKESTEPVGSISGRVTLGARPAPGVKVSVFKRNQNSQEEPIASAKTDQDGYFKLTRLPSNHYRVVPLAYAYIIPEQAASQRMGKEVSLAEGETIEGLDFPLIRGGVITGRITDEDGQPLTGEMITLFRLDAQGQKQEVYLFSAPYPFFATDDQGIYRIYGLPSGRYLVSAGREAEQVGPGLGGPRYHSRTFYPGVGEESKAKIVELAAGTEATGIDIAFGRSLKTYSASGRVIDANTGRPLPNVQLGYTMVQETVSGGVTSRSYSSGRVPNTDARGNFRLDGLAPGNFYIKATPEVESGLYSNVVSFQIKDQDITGLEVKIARGSSISGVLEVKGAPDPGIINKLSQLKLFALVSSPDINRDANPTSRGSAISPDGGFHIAGLQPGKLSFYIDSSKGFYISRVELGGVVQANGIEIRPGEHVAGVRVVLDHGSGRIRGQVKVEGGKLPSGAQIHVNIRRVAEPSTESSSPVENVPNVEVDPNGRFVAENLITGEYQVSAFVSPPYQPDGGNTGPLSKIVFKKISVTNGVESEVVLVVNLIAKEKDN